MIFGWLCIFVLCQQALENMAMDNDGRVVCPRTQEIYHVDELEKVYVMWTTLPYGCYMKEEKTNIKEYLYQVYQDLQKRQEREESENLMPEPYE